MECDKHKEWFNGMGKWIEFDPNDPLRPPLPKYVPPFPDNWKSPVQVLMPLGFIFNCWNEKQYNTAAKYRKVTMFIWIFGILGAIPFGFLLSEVIYYFLHQQ